MAFYFLESSALVKLYIKEAGTERLLELAHPAQQHRFAILNLTRIELHSAIRRRQRAGDISADVATHVLELFQLHLQSKFLVQVLDEFVLDVAIQLLDRYALRAFDAAQLAGYLTLRNAVGSENPIFICSDHVLLTAAEREGAPTLDPAL